MSETTLTAENFETEVLQSGLPVLVDFWAPWCGPCRMLSPVLSALAEKLDGRLKVGKVNVDEQPDLAGSYGISSIPALLVFVNGQAVDRRVGAAGPAVLEAFVNSYIK